MACQPPVSYADAHDLRFVHEPLRSRVGQAMHDSPTRNGLYVESGCRTPYQQWILRNQRCPGRECDPGCQGIPTTALPGHSHHENTDETHCAVDMAGVDLVWLGVNEARYGLWRPVRNERWHFEPHGTPTVPITPYGGLPDPNAGRHWIPFAKPNTNASIYAAGGFDNEVSEIQLRLIALSGRIGARAMNPGPLDGVFGDHCAGAVATFQVWVISMGAHITAHGGMDQPTHDYLRFWTP